MKHFYKIQHNKLIQCLQLIRESKERKGRKVLERKFGWHIKILYQQNIQKRTYAAHKILKKTAKFQERLTYKAYHKNINANYQTKQKISLSLHITLVCILSETSNQLWKFNFKSTQQIKLKNSINTTFGYSSTVGVNFLDVNEFWLTSVVTKGIMSLTRQNLHLSYI